MNRQERTIVTLMLILVLIMVAGLCYPDGGRKAAYRAGGPGWSEPLLNLYESVDWNGDGELSYGEINDFQDWMGEYFTYRHNFTASDPVKFLWDLGGDCEDYALFTCGLLEYWGIETYVGIVLGESRGTTHAISLLVEKTKPSKGVEYFSSRKGFLVPIDYLHVGEFSEATMPGSPLGHIYAPRDMYGKEF